MVLSTTGVQSEAHLAFAGLHQLLRAVRASMERLPGMQRAALDTAFGLREDAAPERFRIAMAALDLLCEVASEAPLLIVAEDIQWLDRPSCDALAFIARRVQSDPIVLPAAAREGYPSPLVDVGLPEYRLVGLAPAAAEQLLDSSAPALVPSMRDRLLNEAGGNPLALIELPISAATSDQSALLRFRSQIVSSAPSQLASRTFPRRPDGCSRLRRWARRACCARSSRLRVRSRDARLGWRAAAAQRVGISQSIWSRRQKVYTSCKFGTDFALKVVRRRAA